jgi:hypothetical protein
VRPEIEAAVADAFREEWGRVVATLIRTTGDWDLAEECAQDAFARALETWPRDGVPRSPGAWLTTTARNRAMDRLRRRSTGSAKLQEVAMLTDPDEPGDDATGELGEEPVASGVDCRNTAAGDSACGAANRAPITTPWLTAAKTLTPQVGHSLPTAQFFEGGVNLTASDLGGACFNTFIGDTRSSASLEATLFDFSRGQLGECETNLATTPANSGGTRLTSTKAV